MNSRSVILAAVALFAPVMSFAATCPSVAAPQHYLVFSRGEIRYQASDFQGLTGAGGNVGLAHFHVNREPHLNSCPSLVSGSDVAIDSGRVEGGGIHAGGSVTLRHVRVDGAIRAAGRLNITRADSSWVSATRGSSGHVSSLASVAHFFVDQSRRLATLRATAAPVQMSDGLVFQAAAQGTTVFQITTEELTNSRVTRFQGVAGSMVVVNIRGANAVISNQNIAIQGGIGLGRIIFNFVDATSLSITASGAPVYGIPATILAPLAATQFWNGLVSGGLYVGSLCGDGQVNPGRFGGWLPDVTNQHPPIPDVKCPPSTTPGPRPPECPYN